MNEQSQELAEMVQSPLSAQPAEMTPLTILNTAMQQNAPVENIVAMSELVKEWQDRQAKQEFVRALTAFKAQPPEIKKTKHVYYETKGGGPNVDFWHADLSQMCELICASLAEYGLSHYWTSEPSPVPEYKGGVRVHCHLMHELGHSISTFLDAPADTSGGKGGPQAIQSSKTLLERYTLLAITGLAAKGQDDGGLPSIIAADVEPEYINIDQQTILRDLLDETGADEQAFLRICKADSLDTIEASRFNGAKSRLEAKLNVD